MDRVSPGRDAHQGDMRREAPAPRVHIKCSTKSDTGVDKKHALDIFREKLARAVKQGRMSPDRKDSLMGDIKPIAESR